MKKIIIGARGSKLSLAYVSKVKDLISDGSKDVDIQIKTIKTSGDIHNNTKISEIGGKNLFCKEIEENLNSIYRQVKVEDFNREEGDRVLLVGYENSDIELSDVNNETNLQTAIITNDNSDSLTIYFDLSFAREFDTNFALRMADFDKVEAS